jgi:hypothetical protein
VLEVGTAVSCTIGGLASGATATVMIVLVPQVKGSITNTARASSGSPPDPNAVNNSSSASVTVN